MARHRQPLAKARLTGSMAKDPQRFRDRREPKTSGEPVGKPPAHLAETVKAVWHDLAGDLAWLKREYRDALELAAIAIAQVREMAKAGEPVTAAMLSAANVAVGKLGATPVDRSKVH